MVDIKLRRAHMEEADHLLVAAGVPGAVRRRGQVFCRFCRPTPTCASMRRAGRDTGRGGHRTPAADQPGDHFLWAAQELYRRGYREVNFNLGCFPPGR